MGVCPLKGKEKLLSQWDNYRFDVFFNRVKKLGNYLREKQSSDFFYLFNLKNIMPEEKAFLDMFSSLDIFSEGESYATLELRDHYLLRRVLLRLVLSEYIQRSPLSFSFKMNPYGKPYLENIPFKVFFNFSHTKDYGFLGVSKNKDIGADIEKIVPLENKVSLLDIFAYSKEKDWVLEDKTSNRRFFILWTAKEALVKAIGTGFLANSIPKLTLAPNKTKDSLYESSYKNYKVVSKIEETLGLVSSICYKKSLF